MSKDFDNIEDIFKESFNDFKVEPQSQVWNKVERNLKWKRFWRFHYQHFNIYYLLSLIAVVVGVLLLWNNDWQNGNYSQNNKIDKKTYPSKIIGEESNTISEKNTGQPKKRTTTVSKPVLSEKLNQKNVDKKNKKHKEKTTTNFVNEILPDSLTKTRLHTPENSKNEKKQLMNNNLQNKNKLNSQPVDDNKVKQESEKKDSLQKDSLQKRIKRIDEEMSDDTICLQIPSARLELKQLQLDTIVYTAYPVRYDSLQLPIADNRKNRRWTADLFYSPHINHANMATSNQMLKNNVVLRSDASSQQLSYTLGAAIGYHLKRWNLQTGLAYTQINENFNYEYNEYDIHSKYYYEHSYSQIEVTDTVGWIQFGKESVYDNMAPVMHSRTETIHDSTLMMAYDTTSQVTNYENPNTYSYLEIPVVLGYSFNSPRFDYTVHGGIIAGILLNSEGKTISPTDNSAVSVQSQPIQNANLIMYGSLAMHYKFSQQFGIIAEPYIKKQINSLFESNYPISQKYNSFGLKIGVRFMF